MEPPASTRRSLQASRNFIITAFLLLLPKQGSGRVVHSSRPESSSFDWGGHCSFDESKMHGNSTHVGGKKVLDWSYIHQKYHVGKSGNPRSNCDRKGPINVVFMDDAHDAFLPSIVTANSLVQTANVTTLPRLHIWIILGGNKKGVTARSALREFECYYGLADARNGTSYRWSSGFWIHLVEFDKKVITGNINVASQDPTHKALMSTANFGRLYMHKILPDHVKKILYIDVDAVITQDIASMYDCSEVGRGGHPIGAVPGIYTYDAYFHYHGGDWTMPAYNDWWRNRLLHFIDPREIAFCAGVMLMDLAQWRTREVHKEFEYWMQINARHGIYNLGTNPVLLLTFYKQWEFMDRKWQLENLFDLRPHKEAFPGCQAGIIHWNGPQKPWRNGSMYREFWTQFMDIKCTYCCSQIEPYVTIGPKLWPKPVRKVASGFKVLTMNIVSAVANSPYFALFLLISLLLLLSNIVAQRTQKDNCGSRFMATVCWWLRAKLRRYCTCCAFDRPIKCNKNTVHEIISVTTTHVKLLIRSEETEGDPSEQLHPSMGDKTS